MRNLSKLIFPVLITIATASVAISADEIANMGYQEFRTVLIEKYNAGEYAEVLIGGFSSGGYGSLVATFFEAVPVQGFVILCPPLPENITEVEAAKARERSVPRHTCGGQGRFGIPSPHDGADAGHRHFSWQGTM